jgi:hypothetical protein
VIAAIATICVITSTTYVIAAFGIILGYYLGNLFYTALAGNVAVDSQILFWIIIIATILVIFFFAMIVKDWIIVVTTSLVGSYAIIRAVGIFFDNFPDEIFVSELIKHGEFDQVKRKFTLIFNVYLGLISILWVIGIIIQRSYQDDDNKKKEEEEVNTKTGNNDEKEHLNNRD